jgi:hypothetical protein
MSAAHLQVMVDEARFLILVNIKRWGDKHHCAASGAFRLQEDGETLQIVGRW